MKLGTWMLCVAAASPLMSIADDAPPPPEGVWTGKGQAGYVSSKGNTDSKSANVALDMALVESPWKHAFHLGGLYGQNAGIVAAERWDTAWQTNHDVTSAVFVFGALRYQHDMFSGFQYQASGTAGVGYKIFDTDAIKLSAQIGAGYRRLRPEDLTFDASGAVVERTPGPADGSAVGTFGVTYSQAVSSTTTLSDKLLVESGSTDTLITNALALAVKISTKLALSVGYNIQDNTKPPSNLKKLDTLQTINLVYSF
jgi:putative salt-induced outer membrane protein